MLSPETRQALRRMRELEERHARALLSSERSLLGVAEETIAEREAAVTVLTANSPATDWPRATAQALLACERAAAVRRERFEAARAAVMEAQREKDTIEVRLRQLQCELSETLLACKLLDEYERAESLRARRAGERRWQAELQDAWLRFRERSVDRRRGRR